MPISQFHFPPVTAFHYFFKRQANQFFVSVAIRSLALGMIMLYEPIYVFLHFNKSIPALLLFFGAMYGLYALVVFFFGKLISKIGLKYSILLSHFFYFAYYLSLFFIDRHELMPVLIVFLAVIAMGFWWPAFHTDFTRFSERGYQGREVGKINVAISLPAILSPVIGGVILGAVGYPGLFTAVLIVLLSSSIPMFLSKDTKIAYTDSFKGAWRRVFKRSNVKMSLALAAHGIETKSSLYFWPLFMFFLAIDYTVMGGIVTFSLLVSGMFSLYMGRMSDTVANRVWFLNIGSFLTAISWIMKYFVTTAFDAFLAHSLYRLCRTSAHVPLQTFFYKKASLKGEKLDEFVIYHEIVKNSTTFLFCLVLALVFFLVPQLNVNFIFILAAGASLMFMLLGVPPKLKKLFK